MDLVTLTEEQVIKIHDRVINPQELQGIAGDKSLDSALARIDNRIQYGVINDVYELAATYAVVLATGHVFNDANKRTAFRTMFTCLRLNDVFISFDTKEIGDVMVEVAQGHFDEKQLAALLRTLAE